MSSSDSTSLADPLAKLIAQLRRLREKTAPWILIVQCYLRRPEITLERPPMSAEPLHPLSGQARKQCQDEARALIQQAAQLTGGPKRDATVWFINRLRQGSYWRPLGWITDRPLAAIEALEHFEITGTLETSRQRLPRPQPPLEKHLADLKAFDLNKPPVEPYVFQEYPLLMYNHTSGATQAARDFEERQRMLSEGWSEDPTLASPPIAVPDPQELDAAESRAAIPATPVPAPKAPPPSSDNPSVDESEQMPSSVAEPKPFAQSWDKVEVSFVSRESVEIRCGSRSEIWKYSELGFANRRNGQPTKAWFALLLMAQLGCIPEGARTAPPGSKCIRESKKSKGCSGFASGCMETLSPLSPAPVTSQSSRSVARPLSRLTDTQRQLSLCR
jgi:hypothetical protein